ncbi:MAG: transporter substrate-binding domain-containing protein [Candidatus Riflebacteria bacterium]|nr:transporter substrate-binding domain-containing protein [Candidatus Riflebacteria bacterium]
MKTKRKLILLCCLAVFVLIAASLAAQKKEPEALKPILSGCETDYPPFCIVYPDGRADGFSVELLQKSLAIMGREVTFNTGTWNEVRGQLERGEIQALPLVGRTPEREELFDFSVPYLTMTGAIVVREDNKDINDLVDLRGRRVAVMKGDNAEEFLRRGDRGIDIITEPTFVEAFEKLASGDCDAVVIQRLVALRLLEEAGLKNLRVLNKPIMEFRQDFCFAVKKGDSRTLALLNEGLALAIADGTHSFLHAKWFASLEIPSFRRIIVGGDHNYPPFEFLDENGRPAGFNVDITNAVAKAVGIAVEIRLDCWPDVVRDLEFGKIDVIQGMLYSPERNLKFSFSQPYIISGNVIAWRKGTVNPPVSFDELADRTVAVQNGDLMHDLLVKKIGATNLTVVETQEEAIVNLSRGLYDCILISRLTALYMMKKHAIDNVELSAQPVNSTDYCFVFANDNKALLAKFSEGLKVIEASGEFRKIQAKWLGIYEEPQRGLEQVLRYVAIVTMPLAGILMLVFLWSWTLRRQVTLKTRELTQSEAHFRTLVEGAPTGIFVQTDGLFSYLNDEVCRLLGAMSSAQLLNKPVLDFVHPSAREAQQKLINAIVHDKRGTPTVEMVFLRLDKTEIPVDITFTPINYLGQSSLLVFAKNISSRKESESELDRLTSAIEQVGEVILITDIDGTIQYANPALENLTGFSRAEVLGKKTSIFKSGKHDRKFYEDLWKTISNGMTWNGRMVNKCKDGRLVVEDTTISPVFAMSKIVNYVAVKHDITEYLRLNEQLQQAQKMEVVGQLAGGVAHDYNNMLGVILGYTELAMDDIQDKDSQMNEYLAEIHKAAARSTEITGQLLAFARKQAISPRILDINECINGMLKMLRRLIGETIDLVWIPMEGSLAVKMDLSQINQIFTNLCVNARDAMSGAGKVIIETGVCEFDEEYCADHPGTLAGRYALLSVSDSGCGMDKATVAKIFEPFFTTKELGRGTGLGLATVFGIVKQNDGFINVYSEIGQGTIFKIYLPMYDISHAETAKKKTIEKVANKGETILVVEDDASILRLASKILTGLGYSVISTRSPLEAVKLAEELQTIDLLLTDVVMPEMNGRELFEELQAKRPGIRCLYMSGYTADVIAQQGILKEGIDFIGKPFSNAELSRAVRQVIDQ